MIFKLDNFTNFTDCPQLVNQMSKVEKLKKKKKRGKRVYSGIHVHVHGLFANDYQVNTLL